MPPPPPPSNATNQSLYVQQQQGVAKVSQSGKVTASTVYSKNNSKIAGQFMNMYNHSNAAHLQGYRSKTQQLFYFSQGHRSTT
jgi:hypothetical protein